MTLKNTADRWGAVSQAFHWIIVLLILGLAVVGLTLDELPRSPKYFWVYTAHKSMGITVLALMLLRLGWRLYAGAALYHHLFRRDATLARMLPRGWVAAPTTQESARHVD